MEGVQYTRTCFALVPWSKILGKFILDFKHFFLSKKLLRNLHHQGLGKLMQIMRALIETNICKQSALLCIPNGGANRSWRRFAW